MGFSAGIRGDVPDGCSRAKLREMKSGFSKSTNSLIAKIDQLFNRDLALENDYLRQENRILRSKFGRRVPLTEADRRILVNTACASRIACGRSWPSPSPKHF